MARPDKAAAVAELTEEFRGSNAVVLTEYRGLTVKQVTELRRTLGGNASYAVVKNTLTKIAAKEAGVEGLDDHLAGPSAIAFVKGDVVEAAKGLRDFAKANPFLVIKGGVLDGKSLSADEIKKLADLESREVLLAKLAGAMKASLYWRRVAVRCAAVADGSPRRGAAPEGRAGPVQRCPGSGRDRRGRPGLTGESTPSPTDNPVNSRTTKGTPSWRSLALTSCSTRSRR